MIDDPKKKKTQNQNILMFDQVKVCQTRLPVLLPKDFNFYFTNRFHVLNNNTKKQYYIQVKMPQNTFVL